LLKPVLLRDEPPVVNAAALSVLEGLSHTGPRQADGRNDILVVDQLRGASLFSDFQTAEIAFLVEKSERRRAPAGEPFYAVGARPDAVFGVLSGEVDLDGEGTLFEGRRGPGAVFGDADLFLSRRKHGAVSRDAEVIRVSLADFAACTKRFPRVGLRLVARRLDVMGGFE